MVVGSLLTAVMRQRLIDSLVIVLALAGTLYADGNNRSNGTPGRNCSTSFTFLRDAYRSCALYRKANNSRDHQHQHQQITAGDVIIRFQELCSSRPRMNKCRNTVLEGCSRQHMQTYQEAMDKSFWFCDHDNKIRGIILRALTWEAAVGDQDRNKTNCIQQEEMESCPKRILGLKKFGRIKSYGNVVKYNAQKVLGDQLVQEYFKALFDCYYDVVRKRCHSNAIPMVIESQGHFFSPPKFGVNVSDIILKKASELNKK